MQETKICSKCNKELPIEDFNFRDKIRNIRRAECKYCHSQNSKNKYYRNKQILNTIKSQGKCEKCGYDRCLEVLEYHHKEPEFKINGVSKLTTHYNLQVGLNEIEKCILLCSNCHREFHFLERNIDNFLLNDFLLQDFNKEDFYKYITLNTIEENEKKIDNIQNHIESTIQKYYCIDCGKEIWKGSTRCVQCNAKQNRKELKISREELKVLIRTLPFTTIGKQFNVSDNAIRRWCTKYQLPKTKKEINSYSNEEWKNI